MKTIKTGILLLVLSLSYFTSFAQSEIFGHWKVGCYFERNQDGSLCVCSICPMNMENNAAILSDFDLEINKESLKIIVDGKSTTTAYTWDSKIEAIGFEFEKTKYTFKVLRSTSTSKYILKDTKCGGVLLMTKI